MPKSEHGSLPASPTGTILSLSDKIDNLIGCYIADLKPTSSSDPYALRRQTLGIIKMLVEGKFHLTLNPLLDKCFDHFPENLIKNKQVLINEIETFIINRTKTVFLDEGFAKDEIEASLGSGFSDIYDAYCKVSALEQFRQSGDRFSKLFEVYKRAKGQLANQRSEELKLDLLVEPAEQHLNLILAGMEKDFNSAIEVRDYKKAYELIANLQDPLRILFEQVKILADDNSIKNNRIALLARVFRLFEKLLDFSKIQE